MCMGRPPEVYDIKDMSRASVSMLMWYSFRYNRRLSFKATSLLTCTVLCNPEFPMSADIQLEVLKQVRDMYFK